MGCAEIYLRISSFIAFASMVLSVSTFGYAASVVSYKSLKLKFGVEVNAATTKVNQLWYTNISMLFFALVSGCAGIYELLLIINPVFFRYAKIGFVRGAAYLFIGFCDMGLSASLGIAAGFITIIASVLTLVNMVLILFGCIKQSYRETKTQFE
ncbi:hypothetical protein GPJ56_003631 [Histomonas meleagridis]|uniref:uncharacterized protein n=1 Tax=Histomonas meleagridis TaxID=135588 RepID=UPI003559AAAA|nr:hypothetical protein GPJ56_003631 [Histomonas meleagridis]KAH0800701.1 hypothetical protein GO595_006454 [Histomonas meleagridis]